MKDEKNKTETETRCPWCNNKIEFEFKHLHEIKTTSKLVKIYKKAEEN